MLTMSVAGAALGLSAASGVLLVAASVRSPRRRRGTIRQRDLRILAGSAASALAAAVIGLLVTGVATVAVLAAAGAAALPVVMRRRREARRRRAVRSAWPDAVDSLLAGVRAGSGLPDATASLATRGPEVLQPAFRAFAVEFRATGSMTDALDVLQGHCSDPVADRVVAALRLARRVGGTDLGSVLRSISVMLRDDARVRSEIEARQSWSVAAARMAVAAPWVTVALLCTRPDAARAYASAAGGLVLAVAGALSVVAYLAMMRIGRLPMDERGAA